MAPDTEPFASVDELEAGWHPLLDSERAKASVLLSRATRLIRAQCPAGMRRNRRILVSVPTCAAPWCNGPWPPQAALSRTVSGR